MKWLLFFALVGLSGCALFTSSHKVFRLTDEQKALWREARDQGDNERAEQIYSDAYDQWFQDRKEALAQEGITLMGPEDLKAMDERAERRSRAQALYESRPDKSRIERYTDELVEDIIYVDGKPMEGKVWGAEITPQDLFYLRKLYGDDQEAINEALHLLSAQRLKKIRCEN